MSSSDPQLPFPHFTSFGGETNRTRFEHVDHSYMGETTVLFATEDLVSGACVSVKLASQYNEIARGSLPGCVGYFCTLQGRFTNFVGPAVLNESNIRTL